MYRIYIDTTKRFENSVKLVKNAGSHEETVEEVSGDVDVVAEIQKVLQKHSLTLDEINEIIPNTGPGSFTGIKTGITVANIINWAKGKHKINDLYTPAYGSEPNITPRKK